MVTDLNFKRSNGNPYLQLTGDQDTPDVLKAAITLMLFYDDPDIRNFNGRSIVDAFPTLPESGFEGISFYLTVAAARIKELLQPLYPQLSDVYFANTGANGVLNIQLNVVQNDATESITVYERNNNSII